MTDKQDMGVVTQADIDAAQGYIDAFNRDGINSKHKLAQHFAAHRLASQADQLSDAADESHRIGVRNAEDDVHPACSRRVGLAIQKAILSLATHPQPSQADVSHSDTAPVDRALPPPDHECGWCGTGYYEGQNFYDDVCNPCARRNGLQVPKGWKPQPSQKGEGDE